MKKALIGKKNQTHTRHTFIEVIISIQLLFKWYSNISIEFEKMMYTECSKKTKPQPKPKQHKNYEEVNFKETIRK